MLRLFETVFVQPALKSDRSPSVNITLRAVTLKEKVRRLETHKLFFLADLATR